MASLAQLLATKTERQLLRLANRSDLTLERLAELAGGGEPTLGEALRLADSLGVPLSDLATKQSDAERKAELLFRRTGALGVGGARAADMLSRRIVASLDHPHSPFKERAFWWQSHFLAPKPTLENVENNAAIFRKLFFGDDQLSPLTSLPAIASSNLGAILFVLKSEDFDGASAIFDRTPFIFLAERFPPRMLFTLAHEIGHLIAHHDDQPFAILDEDIEAGGGSRDEEYYANAFAASLLLPQQAVGIALKTIRRVASIPEGPLGDIEVAYLARIFGVSFWAAARRCEDLELLPRGGAFALHQEVSRAYGSPEKRADAAGVPARPEIRFPRISAELLAWAVEEINAGRISIGQAASSIGASYDELYSANRPKFH